MQVKQLRKYLARWCGPDEAAEVGWAVVGMRAALIEAASESDMAWSSGEDGIRLILRLDESQWAEVRRGVLSGWHKDTETGKYWLPEPVKAVNMPRVRNAGGRKSDSPFKTRPERVASVVGGADGLLPEARPPKEQKEQDLRDRFMRFWEAYPKKVQREQAFTAFKRHAPNDALLQTMVADVRLRAFTRKWSHQDGNYILNASTYLNNSVWTEPLSLNEIELAASTLPEKERRAFFDRPAREAAAWVSTQRVLGQIPTLMDLASHLGITQLPEGVQDHGGVVEHYHAAGVIDVVATPASALVERLAAPAHHVAEQGGDSASMSLSVIGGEGVSTFHAQLMAALSEFDEERRQRILAKPQAKQREWLTLWRAAKKAEPKKSEPRTEVVTENMARQSKTMAPEKAVVSSEAVFPPVNSIFPAQGDDWW